MKYFFTHKRELVKKSTFGNVIESRSSFRKFVKMSYYRKQKIKYENMEKQLKMCIKNQGKKLKKIMPQDVR